MFLKKHRSWLAFWSKKHPFLKNMDLLLDISSVKTFHLYLLNK